MFRIGCVNPYTSTANKSSSFFKKLKRNLKFCYKAIIFGSQTYLYLHIFISSSFCLTLSSRSLPLLPKYVCFYSLLNSRQSDVVFWMFIAVHTFVSEASFSKSIWLVVALCTLFFLGWALNNHKEVVWNELDTRFLYDIYSDYGSSCFLSFLTVKV